MDSKSSATRSDLISIFLFSLCLMLYQTLLTRVFSVELGNHLAFFAVSLAMLGLTVGALIVALLGKENCRKNYFYFLSRGSLLLSISVLIVILHIFYKIGLIQTTFNIVVFSILYSLPMVACSFLVSLILLKNAEYFAKFYSWDLAGAALGCVVFALLLQYLDPFALFFGIATLGLIISFYNQQKAKWLQIFLMMACVPMLILQVVTSLERQPWLTISKSKGSYESATSFERWNAFSRVRVWPQRDIRPFGWGLSDRAPKTKQADELSLNIDGGAYTVITHFDGNLDKLSYLKFDITNLAHYLKHGASVFVVGVGGGGRDVLSSLVFHQASVRGAELNPAIFEALNDKFADFSGHLLQNSKVHLINHEARTYLAGTHEKFDIIEISLVDTWAATASGAFALSENALYTLEGFKLFFDHLKPNGILTLSRWYPEKNSYEIQKLVVLATKSLIAAGVKNPQAHMYLARSPSNGGVGTLLLKKTPFLAKEIKTLDKVVSDLGFEKEITPFKLNNTNFANLMNPEKISKEVLSSPVNIEAPTDNWPFFFMFTKQFSLLSAFHASLLGQLLLATLIIGAIILGMLGYVKIKSGMVINRKMLRLSGYVCLIGLGFMFIEISLMQRLSLFLGHPTYALTITLFTLLLSVSFGSLLTSRLRNFTSWKTVILLCVPLALLANFTFFNLWSYQLFGANIIDKIIFVIALIFPVGMILGMPMPLAIATVTKNWQGSEDVFWTLNGLSSAIGSILAVIICIFGGISLAYELGVGLYFFTFLLEATS